MILSLCSRHPVNCISLNSKIMKKILGLTALLLLGGGYYYSQQTSNQEETIEMTVGTDDNTGEYKASIPGWTVGIDKVFAESERTGKPIMANFTGSDWCTWCHRLRASVFDTEEFKTWAAENVVLYEVDFPNRSAVPEKIKQENAHLQQQLQVRGFPTVWIIDAKKMDGKFNLKALGSLSYDASATSFIKKADKILKKR